MYKYDLPGENFAERHRYVLPLAYFFKVGAMLMAALILCFLAEKPLRAQQFFSLGELPESPLMETSVDSGAGLVQVGFYLVAPPHCGIKDLSLLLSSSHVFSDDAPIQLSRGTAWKGCTGDNGDMNLQVENELVELYLSDCDSQGSPGGHIATLTFHVGPGGQVPSFEILGGSVMVENVDFAKRALPTVTQSRDQILFRLERPGSGTLSLFDLQGQQCMTIRLDHRRQASIPGSRLQSGIYFWKWDEGGSTKISKVLILH